MSLGFVAKKLGCSSYVEGSNRYCVTLVKLLEGCVIGKRLLEGTAKSTATIIGFNADTVNKHVKRPQVAYYKKHNLENFNLVRDFNSALLQDSVVGDVYGMDCFSGRVEVGDFVHVRSDKTIGKGFAGVVKRYGFAGSPASHGTSLTEKSQGSTGQQNSERVFKGKKMAGRMGGKGCTMKNIRVAYIDQENKLIALKGSVPGPKNSLVVLNCTI